MPTKFHVCIDHCRGAPECGCFYNQNDIANGNLGFAWFDPNGKNLTFPTRPGPFLRFASRQSATSGHACHLLSRIALPLISAGDANFRQTDSLITNEGNVTIGQPALDAVVTVLSNCTSDGSFQVVANSGTPNYLMTYKGPSGTVMVDFAANYTVTSLTPGVYIDPYRRPERA